MHLLKYLPLAFAALSIAAPASKAKVGADTVIADIGVISQKNQALLKVLTPFQGGLFGLPTALKINDAGNEVKKAITQTIKDAQASAPFSDQEALNIGLKVIDFTPGVIQTLDTFKTKRKAFDNPFPLSFVVKNTLLDQKKSSQQLIDAISAKLPDQYKQLAGTLSQPLSDKFDEVIAAYS